MYTLRAEPGMLLVETDAKAGMYSVRGTTSKDGLIDSSCEKLAKTPTPR